MRTVLYGMRALASWSVWKPRIQLFAWYNDDAAKAGKNIVRVSQTFFPANEDNELSQLQWDLQLLYFDKTEIARVSKTLVRCAEWVRNLLHPEILICPRSSTLSKHWYCCNVSFVKPMLQPVGLQRHGVHMLSLHSFASHCSARPITFLKWASLVW